MKRNRLAYLAAILVVIALGLASRRYPASLPRFVAEYAGDSLWSLAVFLGIGLLRPTMSTLKAAAISLTICYAIELSQLYQAPWINQVRDATFGLVLGYGFLWSDIVCYTVGVGGGAAAEIVLAKRRTN